MSSLMNLETVLHTIHHFFAGFFMIVMFVFALASLGLLFIALFNAVKEYGESRHSKVQGQTRLRLTYS